MTNENEEAIKNLKKLKSFHNGSYGTAIDHAIKALEQTELNSSYNSVKTELKPCEDCISRTKLLSRIDAERKHLLDIKMDGAEHIIVHHARRIIEDMPSVTPKPCEEENPNCTECRYYDKEKHYCPRFCRVIENTMAEITSEQTRPIGKWKKICPAKIYECTNCYQMIMTDDIECYNYCHQCGADMRGEEE